jgi:hypothetical protein
MIPFIIKGSYIVDGVREWCYDQDESAFVVRWRRWATDSWTVEQTMDVPDSGGIGLLNAMAHAHPYQALVVADHLREYGPRHV